MSVAGEPQCFIVKHDLEAFSALPNYIWRTGTSSSKSPPGFSSFRPGHRWIGFAYTNNDKQEKRLSKVTGFYECVNKARYGDIPLLSSNEGQAWLIEGKGLGEQPIEPVGVPPIDDLLGRKTFNQRTITCVSENEFDKIRNYTLSHQLDAKTIPLLGREPECEQEVVAIVVHSHAKFGITNILRVRTAFPDLLVQIDGNPSNVHLELELYSESFLSHGHHHQVAGKRFKKDDVPVAVLCWIHNKPEVENYVHKVYELQSLIRQSETMKW